MKVLCVNMTLDPVHGGGTAERTYQLACALKQDGDEACILSLALGDLDERVDYLKQMGVDLYLLPCLNKRFYVPGGNWQIIKKLVVEADIIHLMGHWTILNAIVFYYAKKLKKPYVICPAGALSFAGRSKIIKACYNYFIGKKIITEAHGIIAITKDELQLLKQFQPGETRRLIHIANGIHAHDYLAEDPHWVQARYQITTPYILFLGRLNKIKGPDLLLEAFARIHQKIPTYKLVFAGPDDGLEQDLRMRATQLKIVKKVHFIGYIANETKARLIHAASALIIPSRSEAMSIVVLEAGALKTPVILTDQCGLSELISVNAGKVVPVSIDLLGKAIEDFCLSSSQQQQMLGDNLHQYVTEHFSWATILKQHKDFFHRILLTV